MSEETVTRAAVVTGGSRGLAGRCVWHWQSRAATWWSTTATAQSLRSRRQRSAAPRAWTPWPYRPMFPPLRGCKTLFDAAVNAFGRVDVLVNNAGITRDGLLLRMSEADFDAVLNANLKGAFLCCKEAARRMVRQRHGRIINLSSVVALRATPVRPTTPPARRGSSA